MKTYKIILLALVTSFAFSCSSDDSDPEPQVTISDFEGSWIASSAVFTNNSDNSESIEFIGAGGEIRYTMLEGGDTRTWIEFQNNAVDEWDAVGVLGPNSTIIFTPEETTRPIETHIYVLENNTITLTNDNSRFDFTNSGTEVAATSVIVFVPNK